MFAHVQTTSLGTYAVTLEDRDISLARHHEHAVVSDQTARTLASWYHSPGECCHHLTALSHGMPFDTRLLRAEIHAEVEPIDSRDAAALTAWLDHLESTAYQYSDLTARCDCSPAGHHRGCSNA